MLMTPQARGRCIVPALSLLRPTPRRQRGALDVAVDQARDMLVEGRDKIVALRGADQVRRKLTQSIHAIGEELASTYGIPFRVTTSGAEKPLPCALRPATRSSKSSAKPCATPSFMQQPS
jgi:signal transduction histidine kinase